MRCAHGLAACLAALAGLCAASVAWAETGPATVTPLFGGGFQLAWRTDREDLEAARASLAPQARVLCQGQALRWGRYQFVAESLVVPPGRPPEVRLLLRQEVHCDEAALLKQTTPSRPSTPPEIAESPADRAAVARINAAFFAARDRGDVPASWQLAGRKGLVAFTSPSAWADQVRAFMDLSGGEIRREWRRQSWYRDPTGAEPGLYVAIDFVADSRALAALCGYAVWRRRGDGNFDLVRIEENTISRAERARFSPEELEATLQRFRCR